MSRSAGAAQAARKRARERRTAMDADRAERDERIEGLAAEVFVAQQTRADALLSIGAAELLIGQKAHALATDEDLTVEQLMTLLDVERAEVRRLVKLATDQDKATAPDGPKAPPAGTATGEQVSGS